MQDFSFVGWSTCGCFPISVISTYVRSVKVKQSSKNIFLLSVSHWIHSFMQKPDWLMFSLESTTASPLDDSLKDITDVAPCRKRRFRHLGAPNPPVKRPNPQSSQRKRYTTALHYNLKHMECHLQLSHFVFVLTMCEK